MDANKQAMRKEHGTKDQPKKHGKDDVREGRQGRYEGGRDADQPRQAHGEDKKEKVQRPAPAQGHERPPARGHGRRGTEEE